MLHPWTLGFCVLSHNSTDFHRFKDAKEKCFSLNCISGQYLPATGIAKKELEMETECAMISKGENLALCTASPQFLDMASEYEVLLKA